MSKNKRPPSVAALLALIKIAPFEWMESLTEAAAEKGLFESFPVWDEGYISDDDVLVSEYESALNIINRRNFSGHAAGVDYKLLWEQILIYYDELRVYGEGTWMTEEIVSDIMTNIREFAAGEFTSEIERPELNYTDEFNAEDIYEALIGISETPELGSRTNGRVPSEWAEGILNGFESEEFTREILREAASWLLRHRGPLKGPCPRCGREKWVVKYRPPKAPGRPPLTHTYCPTCVVAIKREQARLKVKRFREKEPEAEKAD